jgi:predicted TIM-barrel fold metal-dependent hydrolase
VTGPVAVSTGTEQLELIDHHVHSVLAGDLDFASVESLLTEGASAPPPGTSGFDSQLGFAVRRWCAPLLDLEPFTSAGDYIRRRQELGTAEVNRRLLTAAQVCAWLVDTGYQADAVQTPDELAAASGAPARTIARLESVAERVARAGGSAAGFGADVEAAVQAAAGSAVGFKSIAAYRCGLDFGPDRPSETEVQAAADRLLHAIAADPAARITDPVLIRHVIWTALGTGLPVQFHTGYGDADSRLHRADPALLQDFLAASQGSGSAIMLLHCYPYHRQAGALANLFPHVYLDVGEALNHVGARSAAVLAEALELTPFHKMLYSSDAFGLPELHYLGAAVFRRDIARVTGDFVADGAWQAADAARVAGLIGSGNARRVYQLSGL